MVYAKKGNSGAHATELVLALEEAGSIAPMMSLRTWGLPPPILPTFLLPSFSGSTWWNNSRFMGPSGKTSEVISDLSLTPHHPEKKVGSFGLLSGRQRELLFLGVTASISSPPIGLDWVTCPSLSQSLWPGKWGCQLAGLESLQGYIIVYIWMACSGVLQSPACTAQYNRNLRKYLIFSPTELIPWTQGRCHHVISTCRCVTLCLLSKFLLIDCISEQKARWNA